MNLGQAIKNELRDNTATGALLNQAGPVPVRVFPMVMPQKKKGGQDQYPAVVYTQTSVDRQKLYCRTDRTVGTRLELDCYALDYDQAHELADAVRAVLLDFQGALGGIVAVKDVALETEIDLQDPEPGVFRVNQVWLIWHAE